MEIMQAMQILPQTAPPAEAPSEKAAATSAAGIFATLFAGLLVPTADGKTSVQLSETTSSGTEPKPEAKSADDKVAVETASAVMAAIIQPQAGTQPAPTDPQPQLFPQSDVTVGAIGTSPGQQAAVMIPALDVKPADPKTGNPVAQAIPMTEATKAGKAEASLQLVSALQAVDVKPEGEKPVEVLEVKIGKPVAETPIPRTQEPKTMTERTPEAVAVVSDQVQQAKPEARNLGSAAAYADRISAAFHVVTPKPQPKNPDMKVEGEKVGGKPAVTAEANAELAKVEVVVHDESSQKGFSGNQEGFAQKAQTDAMGNVLQHPAPEMAKTFEPALQSHTQPAAESAKTALHESVMSQVKEGITAREANNGNGQISIRLNPAELGELKINVRLDAQNVKVEVLAANSQVRDILLSNLDSLKENFTRQNLTMTGFDVATGNGQGFGQAFREGRESGQGNFYNPLQYGLAEDEEQVAQNGRYYTDRKGDSLLDVRL